MKLFEIMICSHRPPVCVCMYFVDLQTLLPFVYKQFQSHGKSAMDSMLQQYVHESVNKTTCTVCIFVKF